MSSFHYSIFSILIQICPLRRYEARITQSRDLKSFKLTNLEHSSRY